MRLTLLACCLNGSGKCMFWVLAVLAAQYKSKLLRALQEVVKLRPDDPLEFLANYLKEHNPKKSAKADK